MKHWNWGILSTGNIANQFAAALKGTDRATLHAVGSRAQSSADEFAKKWDANKAYSSYEALAADPDVDIIYIGTPHPFHYENMLLCLEAGKHVLCEKPITLNASQAEECIALARQKGLFLMEAVWMRFIPAIQKLRAMVQGGVIGDVQYLSADFMINRPFDAAHRLYAPELGGGALLDLGIYPLSLATFLMDQPDTITGKAMLGRTGVDEINSLNLSFANGAFAHLSSSMRCNAPITATIVGEKGDIFVHTPFLRPDKLTLTKAGNAAETLELPVKGNGYGHEIDAVHTCLEAGLSECADMPLDESLAMMRLMDGLRQHWGITYPGETAR